MMWIRSAMLLSTALAWLVTTATAQQSPSTPEGPAPRQSSSQDSRNAPCQPEGNGPTAPFDTCKYLPVGSGRLAPGIRPPRIVSMVNPTYTDAARKAKVNGSVIIAVALNEEGGVDDVKVVRPLGYGLDREALEAVRQSKFVPATRDGKPVAVQINMETTFSLY